MWFVYILQCKGGSFYTGIAKDPKKRFSEHLNGKGGAYTRTNKPLRIVYTEPMRSKSVALKREHEIKRWPRNKKIAIFVRTIQLMRRRREFLLV